MPATLDMPSFLNLMARSRLMGGDDEVRAIHQAWASTAVDADNLETFKKYLVANRFLTEFQGAMLLRGHSDGFFLGDYKLLDRLGAGRMAGVFKGVHSVTGQPAALKVLPPSKAKDPVLLARFQRESRLAVQLEHPNIVRTLHVDEAAGKHFLVMEYLEGETLEDVLERRKRLPASEAVRIAHQALIGLQCLADKGMVHRDMKPANLMLVPGRVKGQPDTTLGSTVKILDIGLGRVMFDDSASPGMETEPQLTGEGVLLGTPDYLAPEQARSAHNADIRADIYSLGCVLYHMLVGQPPFPDTNILSQIVRHATEPAKPLAEFDPTLPPGLQQILNWMLAKDPTQRYPTPIRAAQSLAAFLSSGADAAPALPPVPSAIPAGLPTAPAGQPATAPGLPSYLAGMTGDDGSSSRIRMQPRSPATPVDDPSTFRTRPPAVPVAAPPAADIPIGKLVGEKPPAAPPAAGAAGGPRRGAAATPGSSGLIRKGADGSGPVRRSPTKAPTPVPEDFDVELVAVPDVATPRPEGQLPKSLEDLDRRDYLMLGIGAGGTLLAVAAALGLVQLISPRRRPANDEPAPSGDGKGEAG